MFTTIEGGSGHIFRPKDSKLFVPTLPPLPARGLVGYGLLPDGSEFFQVLEPEPDLLQNEVLMSAIRVLVGKQPQPISGAIISYQYDRSARQFHCQIRMADDKMVYGRQYAND